MNTNDILMMTYIVNVVLPHVQLICRMSAYLDLTTNQILHDHPCECEKRKALKGTKVRVSGWVHLCACILHTLRVVAFAPQLWRVACEVSAS